MSITSRSSACRLWLAALVLAVAGFAGALEGGSLGASPAKGNGDHDAVKGALRRLPLSFELNEGQTDRRVRYLSRGSGYTFFITPSESYVGLARLPKSVDGQPATPGKLPASFVGMRLVGGNPRAEVTGVDPLPGRTNYLVGRNQKQWRRDVPTYAKVRCDDVYPGVDLVYYGNQQELEHDFIVEPGVNPGKIRLKYDNAQRLETDAGGELLIKTAAGVVRQRKPVAYQTVGGVRREVAARYQVARGEEVRFALGSYDRDAPLVIDPVLRYSTFIGGSFDDYAFSMVLDPDGNAYICGYTGSFQQDADSRPGALPAVEGGPKANIPDQVAFPTVGPLMGDPDKYSVNFDYTEPNMNGQGIGSIDATFSYSLYDGFVCKLNNSGNGLVFSTYLGADNDDYALAVAIDQFRNPYITGQTTSTFWPLVNPLQSSNGGGSDAFVVKLTTGGNGFIYSTYIGGNGFDRGRAIAVDTTGNTHVAGFTSSTNFPVFASTGGIYQAAGGGGVDLFVLSLDASGSAFNYATYLGGNNDERGAPGALTTGLTYQAANWGGPNGVPWNWQTNVPQGVPAGGPTVFPDGFFEPSADHLGVDFGVGLAVDTLGNAYICGGSNSTSWPGAVASPATAGAFQTAKAAGYDGFVAKFDPAGHLGVGFAGTYFTWLGGAGDDAARSVAVNSAGNAFVTGLTTAAGFPLLNAKQAAYAGGTSDAFLTKLNPAGSALVYSTLLGGNGEDIGQGVAVSGGGQGYVTGSTTSTNFPTKNFIQGQLRGLHDVFATKFRPDGSDYEYSTYLGSSRDDRGLAIAVDSRGQAYVTGHTNSSNFPFTLNRFANFTSRTGSNYGPYPDGDVFVSFLFAPPFPASNLHIVTVGQTSIDLAWTDESDNEDGFQVERKQGNAASPNSFAVVGSTVTDVTTFTDAGLAPGTTYTYRVRPFNSDGGSTFFGAYSNQATGTTLQGPPLAASNLTILFLPPNGAKLTFKDNSANETGFKIQRSLDDFAASNVTIATVTDGAGGASMGNITYTDPTPLQRNTIYYYRVVATNSAGSPPDATPTPSACVLTLPVDPTNLQVFNPSATTLQLRWTDNNPIGPSSFKIERSTNGGVTFSPLTTFTPPTFAATVNFTDTGLTPNNRYYYRVKATNTPPAGCVGGGNSPNFTNIANGLTLPASAVGLTVSPDVGPPPTTNLILNWTDPNNPKVVNRVDRSTDNFATPPSFSTLVSAGLGTYVDVGLAGNRTYYYRVVAHNGSGDAVPSSTASGLTLPSKPTGLTLSGNSNTSVKLTWTDTSFAPTAFKVERSTDGGASWTQIGTTGVGATSFIDNGLTINVNYAYRIRGTNASGDGPYSAAATMMLLPAPTGLTAAGVSASEIDLSWEDNCTNESRYLVERVTGTSFATGTNLTTFFAPNKPGTFAGTHTYATFQDTTVATNVVYTYRVTAQATGAGGVVVATSAPSKEAGAKASNGIPAAPTGLTVTATAPGTLRLSYFDNSTNETGFKVERSLNGTSWSQIAVAPAHGGTGATHYDNTGLAANQTYYYRVRATNGLDSPYSNVDSQTTIPAAPSNLRLSVVSFSQINVIWFDNNNLGPITFKVERSSNGGGTWTLAGSPTFTTPGSTKTFLDSGLAPNTTYQYRVRASSAGGDSANAGPASAKTPPPPPAAPSGLSVTQDTRSSLKLTWTDNSGGAALGFKIERSPNGSTGWTQIAIVGAGTTSYTNTGLAANTTYFYRVRAYNNGGDSGYSNTASNTTLASAFFRSLLRLARAGGGLPLGFGRPERAAEAWRGRKLPA